MSEKPIRPKKPTRTKDNSEKVPMPVGIMTEQRVREIAREEVLKWEIEKISFIKSTDVRADEIIAGLKKES